MSAATQGPWKAVNDRTWWEITGPAGECVVGLYDSDGQKPSDADARLLAAAPRMLTALQRLSRYVLTPASKECPFCEEEHHDANYDADGNVIGPQHRPHCQLRTLLAEIDGAE